MVCDKQQRHVDRDRKGNKTSSLLRRERIENKGDGRLLLTPFLLLWVVLKNKVQSTNTHNVITHSYNHTHKHNTNKQKEKRETHQTVLVVS